MRLKGKTALIAGAGRNTGKAISLTYAREGADLILISRAAGDDLKQTAKQCEALGVNVLPLLADLGQSKEVDRAVKQGLERFGKVDTLVSVAAIRPHKDFWEFTDEEWQRVFAVNLHSTFYLARALAPAMMERKTGSIIALAGLASLKPTPMGAAVVTTKHGLHGLIKSLALELGPHNIRANLLNLTFINSERRNPEWYPNAEKRDRQKTTANFPLRRLGTADEVADAALFLASDESTYITGDCLNCVGGIQM